MGNTTVTYTYDGFGRLTQKQTKNGENPILTQRYYFNTTSDGKTSMQIWGNTIDIPFGGYQVSYGYDDNGNITQAFDQETVDASYVYDSQGQLIRENNWLLDFTYVWTYDNAGNILSRTEYDYTWGSLDGITPTDTVVYGYTDDTWGDLLTSYDGNTITYDNIGNPTNDGTWSYTWQHGRQLATMSNGTTTWTCTYDANGMRTSRTGSNGYSYEYIYDGSQLVGLYAQTTNGFTLKFTYDASGTPLTVTANGCVYYYVTNLQGDVIRILDNNGVEVVSYFYDAWGNVTATGTDPIRTLNPLLYRGYVYDWETGLYYLQSRCYNPQWGRFLNADGLVTTGQGFIGNNMFTYCNNNFINLYDPAGNAAWMVLANTLDITHFGKTVYATQDDAAFFAGIYTRMGTNRSDVEYICGIYQLNAGGYIVGNRFEGEHDSVNIQCVESEGCTIRYATLSAFVHSHPFCNGHIPNEFSLFDFRQEPYGDLAVALSCNKPVYLAAPNGNLYRLIPYVSDPIPSLTGGNFIIYDYDIKKVCGGLPEDTTRHNCIGGKS